RDTRATLLAGILLGIGLMAAIDEIVFHQLLGWHHFFDRATPAIGLLSDGLLHSAELIILVAGFFMLARLRERQAWARAAWAWRDCSSARAASSSSTASSITSSCACTRSVTSTTSSSMTSPGTPAP